MEITTLPTANIWLEKDQRMLPFVLAHAHKDDRREEGEKKTLVWATGAGGHVDLLQDLALHIGEPREFVLNMRMRRVSVSGGGFLRIDVSWKRIELYGESRTYGREDDRSLSATLIRKQYPDFTVSSD